MIEHMPHRIALAHQFTTGFTMQPACMRAKRSAVPQPLGITIETVWPGDAVAPQA